jgi:N-acyl-L-homoserine lactone synthetase
VSYGSLLNGSGPEVEAFLRLRTLVFGEPYHDVVTIHDGKEIDQYDNPFAHYLVSQSQPIVADGGVRLYPTTLPYMLQLWPDMWIGDLPVSREVYEITRFGVGDWLRADERLQVKRELVCALLEFGLAMNIKAMIGVSLPRYWQSIFNEAGWFVEPVGPARMLGSDFCTAGLLRVSPEALARVRKLTGIDYAVLGSSGSSQAAV